MNPGNAHIIAGIDGVSHKLRCQRRLLSHEYIARSRCQDQDPPRRIGRGRGAFNIDDPRRFLVDRFGQRLSHDGGLLRRYARRHHAPRALRRQLRHNRRYLLRRLSLRINDLGKSLPQLPLVVNMGEAHILKSQL